MNSKMVYWLVCFNHVDGINTDISNKSKRTSAISSSKIRGFVFFVFKEASLELPVAVQSPDKSFTSEFLEAWLTMTYH